MKTVCIGLPSNESKSLSLKLRDAMRKGDVVSLTRIMTEIQGRFFPASIVAFDVNAVPSEPPKESAPMVALSQEKTEKLYSTVATNIWRIKNQIQDPENKGETKDELDGRAISRIARYVNSVEAALSSSGVEIVGDYEGKPHREGSAVKVISYEDRQDVTEDTYVEVLMPTVRLTTENGQTRLLQPAEVVVGRPKGK